MACTVCTKPVVEEEKVTNDGGCICHQACLRCMYCKIALQPDSMATLRGVPYCKQDFEDLFELFDVNKFEDDSYEDDEEDEEEDEEEEEEEEDDDEDEEVEEGEDVTKRQPRTAPKPKEPKVKPDPLYVLMTKSRRKAIEAAKTFALLEQPEHLAWFNTMSGNALIGEIPDQITEALEKPTGREQFDGLFSLTYALKRYPYWIRDNEYWEKGDKLEKAIHQLGTAWYEMLQRSDDELGIDPEITRPGVTAFLKDFDKMAQEQEGGKYPFPWNGVELEALQIQEEEDTKACAWGVGQGRGRGRGEGRGVGENAEDGNHSKIQKIDN